MYTHLYRRTDGQTSPKHNASGTLWRQRHKQGAQNEWQMDPKFPVNVTSYQGKNYTGALGDFASQMQKGAFENQKRVPENCHRLQCKKPVQCCRFSQWDVKSSPPENKNLNFWPASYAMGPSSPKFLVHATLHKNMHVCTFTLLPWTQIMKWRRENKLITMHLY